MLYSLLKNDATLMRYNRSRLVWKTFAEAQAFADDLDEYRVVGVNANWDTETTVWDDHTNFRKLAVERELIPLDDHGNPLSVKGADLQ